MELRGENNMAIIYGDGVNEGGRAFGLFGGNPGAANRLEFELPDGTVITPRVKDRLDGLPHGTLLRQWAGGGGGYGEPQERNRESVLAEVRDGLLSPDKARDEYGVGRT